MPYAQTDFWKKIVREIGDDVLKGWILDSEIAIPRMKELVSHGSKDSAIYETIEILESDLALYKEEAERRLAQKR